MKVGWRAADCERKRAGFEYPSAIRLPRTPAAPTSRPMNTPLSITALLLLTTLGAVAQETSRAGRAAIPPALNVPAPGPSNAAPYAPQAILQGGVVIPLYPPDSPQLKQDRVREAEYYNMSKAVPGRISSITNIHNPSI